MELHIQQQLIHLFENWAGEQVTGIQPLPSSGSPRAYYRIQSANKRAIGAYNPDHNENRAFLEFSKHFRATGLNVPEIYQENETECIYLLEDLGNITLLSYINQHRQGKELSDDMINLYQKVVTELPNFQIKAGRNLNFAFCYPRQQFDRQSMIWDLNYFKYCFLKPMRITFNEQSLEEDFQTLTDYLLQTETNYFMYRDFQSRNILLKDGVPFYIDYQGGRKGALQYDLASLLYDAKAEIPDPIREMLIAEYLETVSKHIKIQSQTFLKYFPGYVLLRIMQAMGAYGFRGLYEKKELFIQSIPRALINLSVLLNTVQLPIKIPSLWKALEDLTQLTLPEQFPAESEILTVIINSFSYRKGIPIDPSEHGGGFVFDCRSIHNPGRYESFVNLTGKDTAVCQFLEKEARIQKFLKPVFALVDQTVAEYLQRKFTGLTVSFGCTGGQHRSVYCAEALANHLHNKFATVQTRINHLELGML